MAEPTSAANKTFARRLVYPAALIATAGLTFGMTALLMNINQRKQEAKETFVRVVPLDENTVDPAVWGKDFPREYDGYLRTADNERSQFGGSEALPPEKLERDPRLKRIYAGYAFSISYREKRGHAYMLTDQEMTERVKQVKQPGACLHCHASILPEYRFLGNGDAHAGFVKACAMSYQQAHDLTDDKGHKLINHPVACLDCHDPQSLQLRVTRPGFLDGIQNLALSQEPLPQFASIERWRKDGRKGTYDPNAMASRQEMRSFVCGQCHVEYYFKGEGKLLTYPWHNGLKVEQMEKYYDDQNFTDWVHKETGAPMLKAQHPEFELWNQGIHARSGVACADCHMPYKREGALKISDHQVRSPILNAPRACQVCHRYSEEEITARAQTIQNRTKAVQDRAEDALLQLMDAIKSAKDRGVPDEKLAKARQFHRSAQWRVDIISSENSRGFHAPQEAVRVLAEAIDLARQGQLEAVQLQKP
ncbi:MAG TPA: ammonia-forming cytochrome c nitrite reductase subunit c552 [Gemmataceae bacterium]|jgi:nitrite reductase (cytochrome c-552)|nr:ammonia-forming cytochrome c nitrite reductase subunit c552 [Gemmataceae bacterium]